MSPGTIWLASYPKSGNTWFRAVYAAALTGAAPDLNALPGGPIASMRELLDHNLGVPSSDLAPDEIDALRPLIDELIDAERTEPHIRKIHDALFTTAGTPIVSLDATAGALYFVRDPRDVAVSFAHHSGRPTDWGAAQVSDRDASVSGGSRRLHAQVRQHLGSWSDHVLSWTTAAPFPVHVVRYEDCLAAPVATFGPALAFAGLDIDEAAVSAAAEAASFAALRKQEDEHGFRERTARQTVFFRRGERDAWREELSEHSRAQVEVANGETMAKMGYELMGNL